jgi:hypothetical protein
MKNFICFLLLLTLAPGVHAGDKKKKKNQSGGAPVSVPGGAGAGGGGGQKGAGGLSNFSHMGQPAGGGSTTRHPSTHSAPALGGQAQSRSHKANSMVPGAGKTGSTSNPLMHKGGQTATSAPDASSKSTNPLMRRGGQAGSGGKTSNPLMNKGGQSGANDANSRGGNPLAHNIRSARANGPTANPMMQDNRQAGGKNTNPMNGKAAQAGMGGRNRDAFRNQNNARGGHNRGTWARNEQGVHNRTGTHNWQHANHANYRVRSSREVFHNYRPARHDRVWYTSRYDRVVVVGGGYYYWDAGYWYPAWGYDPAFSLYVYDGPIYSYDNLPPDQVTMNVQTALQDDGYYTGDIDGQVGPKTRDALGAYQTDHDLEVTSAIDEPTVESLGLAQS